MELDKITRTEKLIDPEAEELNEYLSHGWKILLACAELQSAEGGAFYGQCPVFYLSWQESTAPWYPEPVQPQSSWI